MDPTKTGAFSTVKEIEIPYGAKTYRGIPIKWPDDYTPARTKIIGLSGRKRSGKDTVAKMLSEHPEFGGKTSRIGFADALKAELSDATGFPVEFIEQFKDKFRLGLQWWGTELRRDLCGENYWIDKYRQAVAQDGSPFILTPDVRFKNEYDAIKSLGGIVVRVTRPELTSDDLHPSETSLDNENFDWTIVNSGTLSDLRAKVSMLALKI